MAVPYDEDIERTLTGIMSKNSKLMKSAETQGLQTAQNVGLGQSTKAVQAAQAAAYNVALPIASQQVQQEFQKGTQAREHAQQTILQQSEQQHQVGMLGKEQQFQAQQLERSAWLEKDRQYLAQAFESNMKALDRQTQERISSMEVNASNKERALASAAAFENNYSSSLQAIMANPDIPAYMRQGMLDHVQAIRVQNWDAVMAFSRQQSPW